MLPLLLVASCQRGPKASPEYVAEIAKHDRQRVASLKSDKGWLTLAGLFWLKPNKENVVGSDPAGDVVLPASAPAKVGLFSMVDGKVDFLASADGVTSGGKPVSSLTMVGDGSGQKPTTLTIGAVDFFVIDRGPKHAVRVRDRDSASRKAFTGFERFAPDESYKVVAKLKRNPSPTKVEVTNVVGITTMESSPGVLEAQLNGETVRFTPVIEEGETDLFLVFGDQTNGHETYGGGRFLYPKPAKEPDTFTLDFNLAENPPCAVTRFATCPLPIKENKIAMRIEAGEKAPKEHP